MSLIMEGFPLHGISQPTVFESVSQDAAMIKLVDKILLDAINKRASDIHFELYDAYYRIRYRHDGLLAETHAPPKAIAKRISSRIKVMANLDISECRKPQDGHFTLNVNDQAIDFRVSTCPTINGEKIVIRILDATVTQLKLESLGLDPLQHKHFLEALAKPHGLILVSGPTGSGKTVTLYSALNALNHIERNILTAEDPVEIKLPGINQTAINAKIGLTFASALRSFLRQDPDIIMIGEIRDFETADIAIKAAQTGHLVLSTLHTNSAVETLTRLVNLGISPFDIASSVILIVAQRLVRQLCGFCKKPYLLSLEDGFPWQLYKAGNCSRCIDGYQNRLGLFEVIPLSSPMVEQIAKGANSLEIAKLAQTEGHLTLYQSGLEKAKQGLTSFEEIKRVALNES